MNWLKYLFLKSKFGSRCDFCKNCVISQESNFEGMNKIGQNSVFVDSSIGKASYCGSDCELLNTEIGKFTCISNRVRIVRGNHPIHDYVSVHPAFYSLRNQSRACYVDRQKREEFKYVDTEKKYNVRIGNDVWIGADVRILEGVCINDGAVIATGAVVCRDIAPYEIVGGVPAKHIRNRFGSEEIERLLELKWWDRSDEWLRKNVDLFTDIKRFLEEDSFGE